MPGEGSYGLEIDQILAGDLGKNLTEEEKSELIKRLNNPLRCLLDPPSKGPRAKLGRLIPMVRRLAQGRTPERGESFGETHSGQIYRRGPLNQTPSERWHGDNRRVEENSRLIELLLASLGQTQPIEPPQERGLEIGPINVTQEASQDALATELAREKLMRGARQRAAGPARTR